eukprot:gb/GECG01006414.1/.p1 GENE.gb/GECG01006414.1/~~gb/GECG01006414.1/.p1  ORF type:complete len:436 (+),score=41.83 gb/GECG01006414.1/:1-1308(+)
MSWILEYKQAAAYYSVGVITTLVAINVLYNATRYAKYHSTYSEGWLQWLRRRLFGEEEKTTTDQTPNVLSSWVELIGNTPMVRINCLSQATGCEIYGKVEYANPGGSSKDRVAKQVLLDASKSGELQEGGSVYEGTSGSTGISLALLCRAMGYTCHIYLPDDQAKEKSDTLEKLGAHVSRVKPVAIVNQDHYVNLARRAAEAHPGSIFVDQFENHSNFRAHYYNTGPEIWHQTNNGQIDAVVMGAGTGGTIAGVSRFLKELKPDIGIFLADPPGSSLYNKVKYSVAYAAQQAERRLRRHRYDTIIEGVGLDRVTNNFEQAIIDDAFAVTDEEVVAMSRYVLHKEGLFIGSSSAMNLVAVIKLVRHVQAQNGNRKIVTLLCDSGNRHLSRFWNDNYLRQDRSMDVGHVLKKVQDTISGNLSSTENARYPDGLNFVN